MDKTKCSRPDCPLTPRYIFIHTEDDETKVYASCELHKHAAEAYWGKGREIERWIGEQHYRGPSRGATQR